MKRNRKWSTFFAGALCAVLVMQLASPAVAAGVSKMISIATGINIFVDDKTFTPTDVNGKVVEPFIYNGTTYLPVRAISNALGANIVWDGSSYSVFIGNHAATGKQAMALEKLDYFTSDNLSSISNKQVSDNLGNAHSSMAVALDYDTKPCSISYELNGKYSRLDGTYFLPNGLKDSKSNYTMTIYGDGNQLWTGTMSGGTKPVPVDINLTGVLQMKIEFSTDDMWGTRIYYFGDTMLYT